MFTEKTTSAGLVTPEIEVSILYYSILRIKLLFKSATYRFVPSVVIPLGYLKLADVPVPFEEPPPSLPPPQPINMKKDSRRTEYEKRLEKVSFLTLLDLKINVPILSSFIGFFMGCSALMAAYPIKTYYDPNRTICKVIFLLHYTVKPNFQNPL